MLRKPAALPTTYSALSKSSYPRYGCSA